MLTNCFDCIHFFSSPPVETGIPLLSWRFLWCNFYQVPFNGFARFHLVFCPDFQGQNALSAMDSLPGSEDQAQEPAIED
ncbi:hypothetical protein [Candidatus Magnetaquicoccus inordinatus]|uniref:hypothetical protein n=1 Tax=Candidatus Magnetaquicoccus inordinatus TaxID=2496818 RepID=UPI00102CA340|nr:hypothetical protein [Candidatus Magnetaquicoccus inordinatus]